MVVVEIVAREKLSAALVPAMLALHQRYYANVLEAQFRADLAEKDWVILLRDAGEVVGFSTQKLIELEGPDGPLRYLFSGDTVVAHSHRRQPGLAGAFGHLMLHLIDRYGEGNLYWFLISKGFRTYRFLPVFFCSCYPGPVAEPQVRPELAPLLQRVARHRFEEHYDPATGVVRFEGVKDHLKDEVIDLRAGRREDPWVEFFLAANPGWRDGDELACLAPISRENLNAGAMRVIERTKPVWVAAGSGAQTG
jgi:hypothetical protein